MTNKEHLDAAIKHLSAIGCKFAWITPSNADEICEELNRFMADGEKVQKPTLQGEPANFVASYTKGDFSYHIFRKHKED